MKKQWRLHNPDSRIVQSLSRQLSCSLLMAKLLVIRGLHTKHQACRFLSASLQHLTPPMQMADMQNAVRRIHRALNAGEKILVFGDYDADGITATALLVAFLRRCGAQVDYAIPYRISDGYGLGTDFIIRRARPAEVRLIITVDCGSSSWEAVRLARSEGIDTIITDHHPVDRYPEDAVAVVNPTRTDCAAGLPHLAGVGVACYLTIALRMHLRKAGYWRAHEEPNLKEYLDLVAVGTIADVAPLIAENRALTSAGLQQINSGGRVGISALLRMSGLRNVPIDAETIAYRLAPRLNAAGRLAHARLACELLLTDDPRRADRLSAALCRLNSRRQTMENDLLQSILDSQEEIPGHMDRPVLVVHGNRWHEGILGIVASRLAQRFNRPAVVISSINGRAKGSARSIEGVDLTKALNQCADLLDRYGGHPMAAGVALQADRIESFKERIEQAVAQQAFVLGSKRPLEIDARLSLAEVSPELMEELEHLGPYGQGNPCPLFMATEVQVNRCQVVGKHHLKMVLSDGTASSAGHPAIQFNAADAFNSIKRFEKIAYRPQWNYWNGRKQLQLVIEAAEPRTSG